MVKVSICIPAYKQVAFLRSTLASISEQSFNDYELIVSDDSPNRDVENLVNEFGFGRRLRYVRNEQPLGSPRNWNAAMALARGEYVKLMHHDDYFLHPDALTKFVEMLDRNPGAFFAFSGTRVLDVRGGSERHHCVGETRAQSLGTFPEQLFMGNVIGAPSATIVRRSLGLEYDTRMKWLVDTDYYIRALRVCSVFAYTNDLLITTPTSADHQVTEMVRDDAAVDIGEALMLFEKCLDRLKDEPDAREIWSRLFTKYNISSIEQLARFGRVSVAMQSYFQDIFRTQGLNAKGRRLRKAVKMLVPKSLHSSLRSLLEICRLLARIIRNRWGSAYTRLRGALPFWVKQAWRRVKLVFGKLVF